MKLLLVDDVDYLRNEIKMNLESQFSNIEIIIPNSFEDLINKFDSDFDSAILDCNLSKWYKKSVNPIKINNEEINDGIDIAKNIFKRKKRISIAIYSTYLSTYEEQIKDLPDEIVRIEQRIDFNTNYENIFSNFKKFIQESLDEKYLNIEIESKSKNKFETTAVETFLSKRIINCKNSGKFLWTLGNSLSWNVKCDVNTRKDTKDKFELKYLHNSSFTPATIKIFDDNLFLNFESENSIRENIYILKNTQAKNKVLIDIFISQNIQEYYINNNIDHTSTLELLKELNEFGKFEAIKYLILQKLKDRIDDLSFNKQYKLLKKYKLPTIMEYYRGQLRKIDTQNDIAYVKLDKIFPEKGTKLERFSLNQLNKYEISLVDSYFDYVIYESVTPGYGFHIEPI